MSAVGASRFVSRVIVMFPPFRWDDETLKTWSEEVVRFLSGFSDDVLARAADNMVGTRKKGTPSVAECVDVCKEAKYWIDAQKDQVQAALDSNERARRSPVWSEDRKQLADHLLDTPLARAAAKENWISSYYDFCLKNARAPNEYEARECRRIAQRFDGYYEMAIKGELGFLSVGLEKLGASMLKNRSALVDRVLNGVVK